MVLKAMATENPGMYYMVEPDGVRTRIYNDAIIRIFGRAFWTFEPCIRAFKHCRPVMSVDGTFLTGQFKGTLLIAVAMMVVTNWFRWRLLWCRRGTMTTGSGFLV